jgi:hypothetical protein
LYSIQMVGRAGGGLKRGAVDLSAPRGDTWALSLDTSHHQSIH